MNSDCRSFARFVDSFTVPFNFKFWLFSTFPPHFVLTFENLVLHCHNLMNFYIVNKLAIVNTFILHTILHNITLSAIITRGTIEKMEILKLGGSQFFFKLSYTLLLAECMMLRCNV